MNSSPVQLRIEVDIASVRAQFDEAKTLLEQAPEGIRCHLVDALLKSISIGCFEFEDSTRFPAGRTGDAVLRGRLRIGGQFERLMAAMRAREFENI